MVVKIVCMQKELSIEFVNFIFEKLLTTAGLHRIVLGGRVVSGCSCYANKHKIIMGIVVPLTRDQQTRITSLLSKSISIVDRVANSY